MAVYIDEKVYLKPHNVAQHPISGRGHI